MSKEFMSEIISESIIPGQKETATRLRALEIKRAGNPIRLLALFVDDGSLFIPLVFNSEAKLHADNRILATKTNIAATYDIHRGKPENFFGRVTNEVLGISYFGQVNGVYCDGQAIDGLKGLHIYYERLNYFEKPEEERELPTQLTGVELIQRVFSGQKLLSYFETSI